MQQAARWYDYKVLLNQGHGQHAAGRKLASVQILAASLHQGQEAGTGMVASLPTLVAESQAYL